MKLNIDEITAEAMIPLIGKQMILRTMPYVGSMLMSRTATGIATEALFEPELYCRFLTRLSPTGKYAEFSETNPAAVNAEVGLWWIPIKRIVEIEVLA